MLRDTQAFEDFEGADIQAAPDFWYPGKVQRATYPATKNGGFSGQTKIKTFSGETPVSELKAGDLVLTRDNGFQPIRWVGRFARGQRKEKMLCLKANALAPEVPSSDLTLSPHQRLLSSNGVLRMLFDDQEGLVRARELMQLEACVSEEVVAGCWHILLQRHEVILANDVWTESFQPDRKFIGAAGVRVKRQLERLCPKLATPEGQRAFPAARSQMRISASS